MLYLLHVLVTAGAVPEAVSLPADERLAPFDERSDAPALDSVQCTGHQLVTCVDPRTARPVSFGLFNRGSPRINPEGGGVYRAYWFEFHGRDATSLQLRVYERARPDGRDSHVSMVSTFAFFPRYGLFTARRLGDLVEVRLPTGEAVRFDAATHEIVGGVMVERGPIDTDPDRHRRQFADVEYVGSGVVIRSDQRGASTRRAVVWGVPRRATVLWQQRACRVRRSELWEQQEPYELRFGSDLELFDFLRERCGWDLPRELPPAPTLVSPLSTGNIRRNQMYVPGLGVQHTGTATVWTPRRHTWST